MAKGRGKDLTDPSLSPGEQSYLWKSALQGAFIFIIVFFALVTWGYFQRNPNAFNLVVPPNTVSFLIVAMGFIIIALLVKLVQYRLKLNRRQR